jgi:uncharacterized protein YndB with AHSA1/START domain
MMSMSGPASESVEISAAAERVFEVICDARTYPHWLVGAQRIRRIDDNWPAEGSAFHHRVGVGMFTVADQTTVMKQERPGRLELQAGVGPFGSAHVRFTVHPLDRERSRLEFEELPASGLLRTMWTTLGEPLMRLGIWGRNAVSLQRLRRFIEQGAPADPDAAAGFGKSGRETFQSSLDT